KRRYAYVLTRKGIAEKTALTMQFLARKMAEYEAIKAEIEEISGELDDKDVADLRAQLEQ
ncbi:MAG: MarR family EPS-associated transcriptional regulator, partial [Rhodobacteraceae bacterium CG17_big_fil_post_rev_8_21_14_2_50_65_11]